MDEILYKSSYPPKNATILGFTPYTLFQFVLSHLRLLLVRLKMVQLTQENIEISVFTSMMSKKAVRLVIGLQIQAELYKSSKIKKIEITKKIAKFENFLQNLKLRFSIFCHFREMIKVWNNLHTNCLMLLQIA